MRMNRPTPGKGRPFRSPRKVFIRVGIVVFVLCFLHLLWPYISNSKSFPGFIVSVTRPFWDRSPVGGWTRIEIPKLRADRGGTVPLEDEDGSLDLAFCTAFAEQLHHQRPELAPTAEGKLREPKRRVFDAFRFNGEFDMLALRLHEMLPIVEKVFVFETEVSSTGKLRTPQWWYRDEADFLAQLESRGVDIGLAKNKIVSVQFPRNLFIAAINQVINGDQWEVENHFKLLMGEALGKHGVVPGDVIMDTDCDEIPRRALVRMVAGCNIPDAAFPLNLEMDNYLYSYEFEQGIVPWIFPRIVPYLGGATFARSRIAPITRMVVANAGWHCSWCFPRIEEFVHKLKTYVHTELSLKQYYEIPRIKRYICTGEDLFDRYPETFTVRHAIMALYLEGGRIDRHRIIEAPRLIMQKPEKFGYLLPGNCRREGPTPPPV